MFNKKYLSVITLTILLMFCIYSYATDYTFTQQSGTGYFVNIADKSDALEDQNELRTIVNDLGTLLDHSKMDGLYPKDLTTGGTLGVFDDYYDSGEIVTLLADYYLKTAIDTIGEMETIWAKDITDSTELAAALVDYYLKTAIDSLSEVEAIYAKDITDSTELASALADYYLKTAIDTIGEVEAIWGKNITDSNELATALADYYLKTAIDTLGELEAIWAKDVVDSDELAIELAAFTGQTNIVTLGTIGTGTWEGTAIADGYVPNNITIDLATLATTFTCTDNEDSAETIFVVFVDGATGAQGAETDGDFTYNPSTGLVTATGYAGSGAQLTGVGEAAANALTIDAKEENTGNLVKGQPVYLSGATGQAYPKVGLADADVAAKAHVIGLAAEAISQNTLGIIRVAGLLEVVDTLGANAVNPDGETWAANQLLYLHTTTGGLTKTEPTVGRVVEVGHSLYGSSNTDAIQLHIHITHPHIEVATGEDIILRLGDSAGSNKVIVKDYSDTEVAHIDSDGNIDGTALTLDTALAIAEGGTGVTTGAMTGLTSILNTALYVGRDSDNKISWDSDDVVKIKVGGTEHAIVSITDGAGDNDKLITQGYADDIAFSNLTEFVSQTAWRVFYSNTDGDITELALGADGTYLRSQGANSAPVFSTPAGAGDMLKAVYDVDEDDEIDVAGGGTEKDSWIQYAIPYLSNTTVFDEIPIGTAGYALTTDSAETGYDWTELSEVVVDSSGLADGEYQAIRLESWAVGETVAYGQLIYLEWSDKEWYLAQATDSTTVPALGIALESKTDGQTCKILREGYIRDDDWNFTDWMVYLSDSPEGGVLSTPPSDSGDQVQRVGDAVSADIMYFNPSIDVGEI